MVKWKHILDVKEAWNKAGEAEDTPNYPKEIINLSRVIASELMKIQTTITESEQNKTWAIDLNDLVDEFVDISEHQYDEEEIETMFNYSWNRLYDWADKDKTCWVKVF